VPGLLHGRILEQRDQRRARGVRERRQIGHRCRRRELSPAGPVPEGEIPCAAGLDGQRQPDELGIVRLERAGLGVERDNRRGPEEAGQLLQLRRLVDQAQALRGEAT
jgi:hypothetical protein